MIEITTRTDESDEGWSATIEVDANGEKFVIEMGDSMYSRAYTNVRARNQRIRNVPQK